MQWFSFRDVGLLAKLPLSATIAAAVPVGRWDQVTDFLIRSGERASPAIGRNAVAFLSQHLDQEQLAEPIEIVARRYLRNIRTRQPWHAPQP